MTLYRDLLLKIYLALALLIAAACGLGATMVGPDLPGMLDDSGDAPPAPAAPPARTGQAAPDATAGRSARPDVPGPTAPAAGR